MTCRMPAMLGEESLRPLWELTGQSVQRESNVIPIVERQFIHRPHSNCCTTHQFANGRACLYEPP
jgi:hypothetical protein